ncbi:MAG TPA: Spy/CpxP family protein refolding chaperone [Xanthobacteraceae bacterium]
MNSTRMRLGVLALAATIVSLPATTQAIAQQSSNQKQNQANQTTDWNALTNVRIEIFKAALQLSPDQQKYWPAVEQAIRATEQAWHQQVAAVTEGRGQQLAGDPAQRLRNRANSLAQRADGLKKLADAWQPLYQTFNQDQKQRAHLLSMDMFRDLRGAVMTQRFERFQRRIERFGQTG